MIHLFIHLFHNLLTGTYTVQNRNTEGEGREPLLRISQPIAHKRLLKILSTLYNIKHLKENYSIQLKYTRQIFTLNILSIGLLWYTSPDTASLWRVSPQEFWGPFSLLELGGGVGDCYRLNCFLQNDMLES